MRKAFVLLMILPILAGCEKPTPTVTAASVGTSVQADAICWSESATVPISDECRLDPSLIKNLTVIPGEFVGFSVDKKIAKSGWVVSINGQRATPGILNSLYYRFNTGENTFNNGPIEVEIYAVTSEAKARGVWAFTLSSR
jgi:hypothetical protein